MKYLFDRAPKSSTLASVVVACLALATSSAAFGQANNPNAGNNRSAVNSRIGSTLRAGAKAAEQRRQTPGRTVPNPAAKATAPAAPQQPARTQQQAVEPQKTSIALVSGRKKGSCDMVEVSLEGKGDLLQTDGAGQSERAGIEFVAGFKYEELVDAYSPTGAVRSIRQYEQAGMKRKVGASVVRLLLDSSRKNIVSSFDGKTSTIFCPTGPMKFEQYELLSEVPFNTTLLDRLLPEREVKLGESWSPSTDLLTALLGVDAVENNTFRMTLTSIVDNFAEVEIYLQGGKDAQGKDLPSTLECASEGASAALNISGKFQYDATVKRITWFGVRVSEQRSESVATPGIECEATLKITVAPLDEPQKLTDDAIEKFKDAPKPEALRLYYNAQKGPWKFQCSRRWKLIEDFEKSTALCYVDRGEAVAQCNILSNGKIDLSTQPTLDAYKKEIQKGLGDRFGEFKQDASYEENDLSIYYVVVDGAYESVPFRWVYYLITDKEGNQSTIMFEIQANLLDRYDDSGNEIVRSFRPAPRPVAGTKAPLDAKVDQKTKSSDPEPQKDSEKKKGVGATVAKPK